MSYLKAEYQIGDHKYEKLLRTISLTDEETEFPIEKDVKEFYLLIRYYTSSNMGSFYNEKIVEKMFFHRDEAFEGLRIMRESFFEWRQYSNWGKGRCMLQKHNISDLEKFEEYTYNKEKDVVLKDGKVQYTKKEFFDIVYNNVKDYLPVGEEDVTNKIILLLK